MSNQQDKLLSSYDYELNKYLIAQEPIEPRHAARLMVIKKDLNDLQGCDHRTVWDLLDELRTGDLIVLNDTRVIKARLRVCLNDGRFAELFLLEPYGDGLWLCLGRPAKRMRPGDDLLLLASGQEPLSIKVVSKDDLTGGRLVQFPCRFSSRMEMEKLLDLYGEMPLPPYIKRHESPGDVSRYQTRYAVSPGVVAAPTAGLHLSDELLHALKKKGVNQATITLHVGLGTFRPLEVENLNNLELHREWVEVKDEVVAAVKRTKEKQNRVFAIGTTSVRALEAACLSGKGELTTFSGHVDLVIKPGFKFRVIDGLLTNFHLPKSSLLLLVSALVGRRRLLNLYLTAIEKKYRFYSYGDAMLITPDAVLDSACSRRNLE